MSTFEERVKGLGYEFKLFDLYVCKHCFGEKPRAEFKQKVASRTTTKVWYSVSYTCLECEASGRSKQRLKLSRKQKILREAKFYARHAELASLRRQSRSEYFLGYRSLKRAREIENEIISREDVPHDEEFLNTVLRQAELMKRERKKAENLRKFMEEFKEAQAQRGIEVKVEHTGHMELRVETVTLPRGASNEG